MEYIDSRVDSYPAREIKRAFNEELQSDKDRVWLSAIKSAPLSSEAIQTQMDSKEVEMNQVDDIAELRRLVRELSALQSLKDTLRQIEKEGDKLQESRE